MRTEARQREVAVRRALGAGRVGIARVLLAESAVLAIAGGTMGLLLAATTTRLLVALGPATLPRLEDIHLDAVSIVFIFTLTVVTGLALGVLPLLRVVWIAPSLKGATRTKTGSRHSHRTRHALMASQVALSLVLLVTSGLLVRSFLSLLAVDPGFDPGSTLTLQVGLPPAQYPDRDRVIAFHHAVLDQIAALPGVTAVSASTCLPLSSRGFCFGNTLAVEGRPRQPGRIPRPVAQRAVAGDYFEAMGMRLVRGRGLDRGDIDRREPVVVINEALGDAYFPDEDPIGRRIAFGYGSSDGPWRTVVGVVQNTVTTGLAELSPVAATVSTDVDIRRPCAASERVARPRRLRDALRGPVVNAATWAGACGAARHRSGRCHRRDRTARNTRRGRRPGRRAGGVHDRASRSCRRRRAAAGSGRHPRCRVVRGQSTNRRNRRSPGAGCRAGKCGIHDYRQGGVVALAGVLVGLAAAFAGRQLVESLLYNVSPRDPAIFATTAVMLFGVATLACWLPARRAARISPVEALRAD